MIRRFLAACIAFALGAQPVAANWCAIPARDGSVSLSGVVNTYFAGEASVSAGATSIPLSYARGAPQDIREGDLLLVIQMQDAEFSSANDDRYGSGTSGGYGNGYTAINQAGRYEFVRAASDVGLFGGTVTIVGATGGGLLNSYVNAPYSDASYRQSFQVVRVPQYDTAQVSGTVTAAPWDGGAGGIVAIDVARRLTFSGGRISVAGLGFRGGAGRNLGGGGDGSKTDFARTFWAGMHGQKGEGIAGAPWFLRQGNDVVENRAEGYPGGGSGRGAPGNAGGGGTDGFPYFNFENSGGGGGGNGGEGGQGGHAWCSVVESGCNNDQDNPSQSGGHPGARVAEAGADRIVMGGGGGAGSNNDSTGDLPGGLSSSGAAGGGLILIRAGEIAGSGTIDADGARADSSALNDASGGGGAGGTVVISAVRQIDGATLSVSARGGEGGSNTGGGTAHGPGGGGGGGFIAASIPIIASISGGNPGTTQNTPPRFGASYGATSGSAGRAITIDGAEIPGTSSGGECTPTILKSFDRAETTPGVPVRLRVEVRNNNPTLPLTSAAFTDSYPAGLTNAPSPAATNSCATGNLGAAPGGNSLSVSDASIPAGGSCTYSAAVASPAAGEKKNEIEAGALTASYGLPNGVSNLDPAVAVLRIFPPMTIVKAGQVERDPLHGESNPTAIPGALFAYRITLANFGGTVNPDSVIVYDATPPGLSLFLGALPGGDTPIRLLDGTTPSALSLNYGGPSDTGDDVSFSNDSGATWTYSPVPDANGVDPAVTNIRFSLKGTMAPGSTATIYFGYILQ
ncbi:hypothetical protein [Allosphingosinicella vermicomposti]|uniref:DUF7933 domain-containing protein n=1 Tax=Allosphingosinicella vermicomposti TaxID=614671 RepID=UPI00131A49EB|nr:hypothetical protein [Allosphingosinicella vermicomposti]